MKNLPEGLIYSGATQPIDEKSKRVARFKSTLRETQIIAKDITAKGTIEYKTLDDLLDEEVHKGHCKSSQMFPNSNKKFFFERIGSDKGGYWNVIHERQHLRIA
ncbi:MAG: hypothetical protein LBG28_09340 [Tannerella sp.]|nr:hypothetical protein [Tannerella sp.]